MSTENIESMLRETGWISPAVVHGDRFARLYEDSSGAAAG